MSIRNMILGAFIVVTAVALLAMALTSRALIGSDFERYAQGYRTVVEEQWEYVFRSYYVRYESWDGVERMLAQRERGRGPSFQSLQGYDKQGKAGTRGILPGEGLLLADAAGKVLLDSDHEKTGQVLSADYLEQGIPVMVNSKQVGTLIMQPQPARLQAVQTLEEQFSSSLLQGVLWGGLIALLFGLVLGILLAGQVTRPLVRLTHSARRFAKRDFQHRVQLQGSDEFGKLAEAFNLMAQSIEENENLRQNLLADVSHELRTPLTILRGNFEALQSGRAKATPELLSSLYDEVLRLGRLVSDLEALNLAEAGKLPLHFREVEAGALLNRAAAVFQYEADEREIELQVEVDPEIGAWNLDEDRIVQVLINLLANAFACTPDGGNIILVARRDNDYLHFEVVDSGPGIDQEEIPFLFARFYKGGRGRSGGRGLGLSIAKSLVEAHGGTISVRNRPVVGSIFCFSLPACCGLSST